MKFFIIDTLFSLSRVLIGVSLATILGVHISLVRYFLPKTIKENKFFSFFWDLPRFPPPIAWIPFVIILFGVGEWSAYVIVFIGALSPICINSYDGLENVNQNLINTAKNFEINGFKYIYMFLLKAASPSIISGIKAALSMGWMSVIAAEMVSGQSGLGYSMQLYRLNLDYFNMVICMILIGLVGFFLTQGISVLQRRIIFWADK